MSRGPEAQWTLSFVPGVCRGYAILPYGPRENESAQDLPERDCRGHSAGSDKPTLQWEQGKTPLPLDATFAVP